ncbi:MAG: sensor histidine kinase [Gammaproteobacteria bacterium]
MNKLNPGRLNLSFGGRLYLRIYAAMLVALLLAAAMFGVAHWRFDPAPGSASMEAFAEIAARELPGADAPPLEQRAALWRWRRALRLDITLYEPDGRKIAQVGPPVPPPPPTQTASGPLPGNGAYALRLDDGRWLVSQRMRPRHRPFNLYLVSLLIALGVGIAAYPVVRRLTRRLERLQDSVERWGEGKLGTRVAVEGNDEVARVAGSFNQAAERIEAMMTSQKTLLANASHELRSPLARIRMASELMGGTASGALREELNQNIAELDQIIDELLLASRLDAATGAPAHGPVALTAIAAEECARAGARLDGSVEEVEGDARLLRRLLRNLLENGRRYGDGSELLVRLAEDAGAVRIDVCDGGPGIPPDQREAIFAPFYRLPGASEAAGGVGLGLSLVRQIARHHGGDVVCLANPGGGCCFRVTLPRAGRL